MIGQSLGRFRILAELGRGGMGIVYEAEDPLLARRVALKVLRPEQARSARGRVRFLGEARSASRLDHPGIASVLDAGDESGTPYIAYQLVDGVSLDEVLRRGGPLTPATAIEILRGVADALQHAHERGILHRDVKSSNVMIDRAGRPVIVDFGIARAMDAATITQTGSVPHTVAFAAPEVLRGERADIRSEVYSLGVLAYELLTGELPVPDLLESNAALAEAIQEGRLSLEPLDAPDRDVPHELRTTVRRLLQLDPAARPASAEEVRALLSQIPVSDDPGTASIGRRVAALLSSRPVVRSGLSRRRLMLAGLGMGLLTSVGLVAWSVRREPARSIRVAVLPLERRDDFVSGDVADGIAREIAGALIRLPGLRVTPWETSRAHPLAGSTVHDVQSALRVDRLVVGDVGQDQGRLIGTLTIIDAVSGDAQASIPFLEADDEVIPLLSQLARAVGLELLGDLPAEAVARLVEPISRDERAYRLYTEGAALLRSREDTDHVAAFRRFEEATTLDPGFAHAHLGIGSVCAEWYFRCVHGDQALIKRAESAFEHALRLRPDLPASMGGLISTSWLGGQHSERCLELGRQAAALGNDHVEGQASYAMGLLLGGLAEDAMSAFERVQALDPANQSAAWFLPIATAWSGAHDRTPGLAEAFFERFGDDDEIYLWKAISHDARGEAGKAKEAFDQALRIQRSPNLYIEFYAGHFYARQGNPSLAEAVWQRGFRRASTRVAEFPDHPRLRSLRLTLAASLDEERPFEEDLRYLRASPSVGDQVYASIGLAIAGRRDETLSALEAVVRSGWFIGYFHFFEHLLGLSWLQADPRYREVIRRDHAQRAKLRDRYVVT